MALSREDIEELKGIFKPEKVKPFRQINAWEMSVVDVFQKVAVMLTAAGVIWLVGSVSELQRSVDVVKVTQDVNKTEIDKFRTFAEKPRFTFDDFNQQIAPISQRLGEHSIKLKDRNEWMNLTNERISKLESKYDVIIEKLTSISAELKNNNY